MNATDHNHLQGPTLRSARFIRLLVAQSTFSFGWSLYLLAPKFFTTELGADAAQLGKISAMAGICSVAGMPLAIRVIDRGKRKSLFFLGTLALACLSSGYLFVDHLGPLCFVLQGLVGVSFVFAFNGIATMATDEAPPAQLGQALGLVGASNMLMNSAATVIGESISLSTGWHAVFGLGLAGSVVAALTMVGYQERIPANPARASGAPIPIGQLVPPLLACTLIGATFIAMFVFFQPFAIELGADKVRSFFVGFTAAAVAVRVGFGGLGDRYGRRPVSLAAAVLYAVACFSMANLQVHYLWLHGAVLGVAHGVLYPTLNAAVLERVPAAARGRAMAFYNGAFGIGTGLAGFAWGPIAKSQGYATIYYWGAGLALLAAALLVERSTSRLRTSAA